MQPVSPLLQDGTGRHVWLQLLEVCVERHHEVILVLEAAAEQLDQAKVHIAHVQELLSGTSAAQQLLADMQVQLLETQQVLAEQSARIAAMLADLQEHAGAQEPHGA